MSGLSACNKCGAEYPSAPPGTEHKCGSCSGGFCHPILETSAAPGTGISETYQALIDHFSEQSKLRFFMGVIVFVARYPTKVDNHIDSFVGWHPSEQSARGAWVDIVLKKHADKEGGITSAWVDDITDAYENRP